MKKSFSKRIISLILAVMMLVTAAPLVPFTADAKVNDWTANASADFTKLTSDQVSGWGNSSINVPAKKNSGISLLWNQENYWSAPTYNGGVSIGDGCLYLNDSRPVIENASAFKIDFEFAFSENFSFQDGKDTEYGFLTLGEQTGKQSARWNSGSFIFAQGGDGRAYAQGTQLGSNTIDHYLTTDNTSISANVIYHYILTYEAGKLSACIADANQNPIFTLFESNYNYSGGVTVKSVRLGDDDSSYYYQKLIYKSVTFYSMGPEAMADDGLSDHYVFAYFTGDNEGQQIRFALSSDGHTFAPLNGNNPYLTSTTNGEVYPNASGFTNGRNHEVYSATGHARDPFIIKKVNEDGYWIVATDLFVGNGGSYNNSRLLVWDVEKLSTAQNVKPWNIETERMFIANNSKNNDSIAWAPEVVYDYSTNRYVLYWSGPTYSGSTIRCAYTTDFKTFYTSTGAQINGSTVEPESLYSYGNQFVIDADIVYNSDDGYYYMVYKCEKTSNNDANMIGTLWITRSKSIQGLTGTTPTQIKLTGNDQNGNRLIFEGPELYQLNDGRWALITDQYSQNPSWDYYMIVADNLTDFFSGQEFIGRRDMSTNINDCLPRHGAVARVTEQTYKDLTLTSKIPDNFPYSGTAVPIFNSSAETTGNLDNAVNNGFYKNVLWSTTNPDNSSYASRDTKNNKSDNSVKVAVTYAETTFLYDGVTRGRTGIIARNEWSSGNNSRWVEANWIEGKDLKSVNPYWKGDIGNNNDASWALGWASNIIKNADARDSSQWDSNFKGWQVRNGRNAANNGRGHVANIMEFTGGDNKSYFKSGEYYRDLGTVTLYCFAEGDDGDSGAFNRNDIVVPVTGTNHIYVLNYKPIYDNAQAVKDMYAKVMSNIDKNGIDFYCPESLDSYLAAVAKITMDINTFFMNKNYVEKAANYIQEIMENGAMDIALSGPSEARIRYGNLFHFDAYVSSGSLSFIKNGKSVMETNDGYNIDYNTKNGTITVKGAADSYTSMENKVDTYKLPVTPGEKYIFEFTSDSTYADAMIFVPNDDNTSYDPGYVSWRPHGKGTQKVELTIPAGKDYVFFRVGVSGATASNPQTVTFSKIKFYKSEYEYWASTDNTRIIGSKSNGLVGKANSAIWFTTYTQPFAKPTDVDTRHFCNWYADEALTKKVMSPSDAAVNGCAVLYPLYSPTEMVPDDNQPATCTGYGKLHEVCTSCKAVKENGAVQDDLNRKPIGHDFVWNSKVQGKDNYKFVCEHNHDHSNVTTDSSAYEYVDMLKDTLDPERYENPDDLRAAIAEFEAMKTTHVSTLSSDGTVLNGTQETQKIQNMIDAATRKLIEAAHRDVGKDFDYSTYTITFEIYENGHLKHTKLYDEVLYQSVDELDATPFIPEGAVIQAWTIETADHNNTIKAVAQKEPTNVYKARFTVDTTVRAYYVTDDQSNVVTICDQYYVPMYVFTADKINIGYRSDGTPDNNVISEEGVDYVVPDMPYMIVEGFLVNDTEYKEAAQDVVVDGSVRIVPIWSAPEETYDVTLDGKTVGDGNYKYDDRPTVTAPEDVYGIAIKVADGDYRIATYDNEYTFFVNRDMEFFTVTKSADGVYTVNNTTITDDLTIFKLDNRLPFVYSAAMETDKDTKRYTSFNAYTVMVNSELNTSDVQVIEVGTLFYKGIVTDEAQMTIDGVIDGTPVSKSISRTQVLPGNQYSLSAKGAVGSETGFTTRAYVKYMYKSPLTGRNVVAIEYGNICSTNDIK